MSEQEEIKEEDEEEKEEEEFDNSGQALEADLEEIFGDPE